MFNRLIELIGIDNFKKIQEKNILLVGCGGVGGFIFEALIRSGIKNITIYDKDKIDITNLNRQIITNKKNIGKYKVKEAFKRAKQINEDINLKIKIENISSENINDLENFDYIIDACDDIKAKVALIKYATQNNIKIISALGTGKRLSSNHILIKKLSNTCNDPLAKKLRSILKKENIGKDITIAYSEELPIQNGKNISSAIFTPAITGIKIANYVIEDIIKSS